MKPAGQAISWGYDDNKNTVLDAGEVKQTSYVCNGATGAAGATALVRTESEPAGPNVDANVRGRCRQEPRRAPRHERGHLVDVRRTTVRILGRRRDAHLRRTFGRDGEVLGPGRTRPCRKPHAEPAACRVWEAPLGDRVDRGGGAPRDCAAHERDPAVVGHQRLRPAREGCVSFGFQPSLTGLSPAASHSCALPSAAGVAVRSGSWATERPGPPNRCRCWSPGSSPRESSRSGRITRACGCATARRSPSPSSRSSLQPLDMSDAYKGRRATRDRQVEAIPCDAELRRGPSTGRCARVRMR